MSNPALRATSTESPGNSKNIGSTTSMVEASHTVDFALMLVRCAIWNRVLRWGLTRGELT